MIGRYVMPLDPDCPVARDYLDTVMDDPMTRMSGCGEEIMANFERAHRLKCVRCQEFGAANIEVQYE